MVKKSSLWIYGIVFISIGLFDSQNTYTQTQNCFRIGAHSACGPDWGKEHMFLNLFMQNSGGFAGNASVPFDTNGYPVAIPYGSVDSISTFISRGEGVLMQDTVYVCRWDGEGDFSLGRYPGTNTVTIVPATYSSTTSGGRFEFYVHYPVTGEGDAQIMLRMKRSKSTNHVRNIRIYKKCHENLYEVQGLKYDPDFLKYIQPLWMIRFMGAFNTNNSPFRIWADRTTPAWNNQSSGNHGCGLAYEWACDLCNYAKKNMWFNVPHAADNDAIRKMAQTVYKNLNSDLDVYLEYSNETWNYASAFYSQFTYTYNYPGGHAALTRNVFNIWREVFGKDSLRVKRVLASIGVSDVNHISMGRIQSTGLNNFDVWSVSYYWGLMNTSWCSVDQAINDLYTSVRDINGEWHKRMKNHSDMAKMYGKEMYCYEGGWGSNPQDYHDFSCLSVVQQLQIDPRIKDLTREVFDTLKNFGIYGGNELSLVGGWKPNAVNDGVSFWGLFNNTAVDPMTFPKYAGVAESIEDCDHLLKTSDTIGSGMAFRMDGVNDYADASIAYKPNDGTDNYTIETWIRPEYLGADQYIWSLAKDLNPAGNNLYIGADNRVHWVVRNNAGGQVASLPGSLVELNKWYHIMAVKNGTTYKLYINGSEKASATGNITGDCSRSRLIIGACINNGTTSMNFRGRVDEFRIWNTAISSLTTIRDWMCRKIKSTHPDFSNLRAYYRFDIVDVTGKVKDQFGAFDGQLYNVGFSKYSNYESSGAPIGDNSVQIYPPNWNSISLSYYHANGDRLTVNGMGSGNPEGVHIYMVGQKPTNATTPSTQYLKIGSYYYGVFVANGTAGTKPAYDLIYNYAGNPDASSTDASNRLLKRANNDDADGWQNSGAALNAPARTLLTRTGRESYCGEYIIGQRPSMDNNLPGPGYALKFNGTNYAEMFFDRPDSAYTISFWYMKNNTINNEYDLVDFYGPGYTNSTKIKARGSSDRICFYTEKGGDPVMTANSTGVDRTGGWNHCTVIKKNDVVTLYLNGRQFDPPVTCGISPSGLKRDINLSRLTIGEGFQGWIDELQVWDMALDTATMRKWMCREITKATPGEAQHLLLYYKFDEGTGSILENTRGAGDIKLIGGMTWDKSSAPVGDTSVYVYYTQPDSNTSATLKIKHSDGDYLKFTVTSDGSWDNLYGVHLYRVDGAAQFSAYPSQAQSIDTTRYWGVFVVPQGSWGSMQKYRFTATYSYYGNKNVIEEANLRMLDRANNGDSAWHYNATPTPDINNDYFSPITYETPFSTTLYPYPYYGKIDKEFMLCGTTPTAIVIDTSKPAQPTVISGPTPICAGSAGVVYSVTKDPKPGVFYVWTLPAGMAGYSDSNKIIVTISPVANGNIGNIEVYAANRNGASPERTLAITVQSVPSLSVDINGPVEVCSGQTATYSIPPVPGTYSYMWFVPDDAIITINNGTSINVQFGIQSGQVSVLGTYSCGTSLINNKAVTVNIQPDANLTLQGNHGCKGVVTEGYITIKNSQIGVQYIAYKNGGISPVGQPAYGTGMDLRLIFPLSELLAGDNVITVKARVNGCSELTMTQTATFSVDIAPDPNMPINYNPTVCSGDTAIISFPDALEGMKVIPKIISYWRVDDPTPKYIPIGFILEDPDKSIGILPSRWNGQLSSGTGPGGINKGRNDVTFTVENGSCPTVTLAKTAVITVPNSPHTLSFNSGMIWWITTGSPWNPIPNFADSINVYTNRSTSLICQSDSMTYTITNAQAGVRYYARIYYNTSGFSGYVGPVVSNVVDCSVDHSTIVLKVPSYSMPVTPGTNPGDFDRIQVMAEGFGCNPVLSGFSYQVLPGPDTTRLVVGSTICVGDNGTITIRNSQSGLIYRAYYTNPVTPVATVTSTGGDAVMTIPAATFSGLGIYSFTVTVGNANCLYIAYPRKAIISVVNISSFTTDNIVKLAFDCDTTCKGLDDSVWVYSSMAGVSYQAWVYETAAGVGSEVTIGTPTIGTGMNLAITLPYTGGLSAFDNKTVTIRVKATAGSCAINVPLTNTKQLYINGTVDLTNESLLIEHASGGPGGGSSPYVCPNETSPTFRVQIQNVSAINALNPALVRAAYVDTLLNVYAYQKSTTGYDTLVFNRTVMPKGSIKNLKIYVKEKGCPLHKAKTYTNINLATTTITSWKDYDLNLPVLSDTVCVGDASSNRILNPQVGAFYRLWDTVAGIRVSSDMDTYWRAKDFNGSYYFNTLNLNGLYLDMPILAGSYLHAGQNEFKIEVLYNNYIGCSSGWLNNKAIVYSNTPPDQTLSVEGNSVCNANGTAIVNNTQSNVIYQPVMGSSTVGAQQYGNGSDILFAINRSYLAPGTNEISLRAVIKGCPAVTLNNKAAIQVVSSAPAKPTIPVGQLTICPGDSDLVYRVALDSSALAYGWNLPVGATTVSTSNIAPVAFGSSGGNLMVAAYNVCGTGPFSDPITVNLYPATQGGNVSGPAQGCPGEKFTLALHRHVGTVTKWQFSTAPGIWNDLFIADSIITTPAVTDTANFRAEVISGTCGSVYSPALTIAVPEGTVDTNAINTPISISGNTAISCLQTNELYTTNITGRQLAWTLNNSSTGQIIPPDTSGSVSINWPASSNDTILLTVTYPELGCSRMGMLPVNVNELLPSYRICIPAIELSGNSIMDTSFDARPNISCNFSRIYNDFNNQSTLQGEMIKESEVTVTWHLISITGKDSICVSTLRTEPNRTEPNTIPSAFSPNDDGNNDTWFVPGLDVATDNFALRVFDRWGQLVYDHKKVHRPWDGKDLKGTPLPVESYYYYIDYKNGKKPKIGIVTIVR